MTGGSNQETKDKKSLISSVLRIMYVAFHSSHFPNKTEQKIIIAVEYVHDRRR